MAERPSFISANNRLGSAGCYVSPSTHSFNRREDGACQSTHFKPQSPAPLVDQEPRLYASVVSFGKLGN